MSEQQYPVAWAVAIDRELVDYFDTEADAREYIADRKVYDPNAQEYCEIVRLIPQPTVDRLIAEAEQRGRDQERERCRRIANDASEDFALFRGLKTTEGDVYASELKSILEAIDSGVEPGEGGE